jgi:hypothetical protein
MTATIIQNKNKDGAISGYKFKEDQSCVLHVIDGIYIADKQLLVVKLQPKTEADYEVIAFENKKKCAPQAFEWPIQVSINCKDSEVVQAKAIAKYFEHDTFKALASGFAGTISYSDSMPAQRIAGIGDAPEEWCYQAVAQLVAIESTIDGAAAAKASQSYGAGNYGAKAQTEAERIADRLAYLAKACTTEFPEGVQLAQLCKDLDTDKVMLLTLLFN